MPETKPTPGPWRKGMVFCKQIIDSKGVPIAMMSRAPRSEEEAEANYNLCLAAPDMLEALEFTLARLEEFHMADGIVPDRLRRAIAKAKGEAE